MELNSTTIMQQLLKTGGMAYDELNEYCANAKQVNYDLLMRIIRDNADTEYGKKYDFKNINSIEEYKAKVPFSVYDNYAEAIERMESGEKNLITVYPINHYAVTSGSVDNPKNIPVSQETLDIYEKYASNLMISIANKHLMRTKQRPTNNGRRLISMEIKLDEVADGTSRGPISATVYMKSKPFLPLINVTPNSVLFPKFNMDFKYLKAFFALKEADLSSIIAPFMTALVDLMRYIEKNWEMLTHDIETGVIDESINIPQELRDEFSDSIKPDPERASVLRREFESGFDTPIIPRIWPAVDCIAAIGAGGFSVYTDKMRRYSGDILMNFLVYGASESLMAIATEMECMEYTLLPQSGFYEFIPADSEDDTKTYNLDELEPGKEYEIVLTNLSGFYRYRIGDVVRVTGYQDQSPKLCFVYRKKQVVSIAGEKTNEASLAWAINEFEKESGATIFDYSIYADTESYPGRYVLFMEPGAPLPKENHSKYRDIIEDKLSTANPSLGAKIKSGVLGAIEIKFLQQESYYLYRDMMVMRGVSENQLKPVRVIDTPAKENFFFALIDKM